MAAGGNRHGAAAGRAAQADGDAIVARLRGWAHGLGFCRIGVADVDLSHAEEGLLAWLRNGFAGTMDYMAAHGPKRARPAELVPGTVRVISAAMDYLPRDPVPAGDDGWRRVEWQRLADPVQGTVSLYARGRDYHRVLRPRLRKLADRLAQEVGPLGHRVFTDSAPVLEVELAARSGIGWRGKHTLALARDGGSMFFLGEIYVDLALPLTPPVDAHCGACTACLDACPTGAIVAPYRLDARRCISYLTIEHHGAIPVEHRAAIGNRIVGCDDCQLACPWNKYARRAALPDFDPREPWGGATLLALWQWDEAAFLRATEGSAMRRVGFERWRRNLAVALGNALAATGDAAIVQALRDAHGAASPLVREHVEWALAQAGRGAAQGAAPRGGWRSIA